MERVGRVQQKVSCVFETGVVNEASSKRENQSYKVCYLSNSIFLFWGTIHLTQSPILVGIYIKLWFLSVSTLIYTLCALW